MQLINYNTRGVGPATCLFAQTARMRQSRFTNATKLALQQAADVLARNQPAMVTGVCPAPRASTSRAVQTAAAAEAATSASSSQDLPQLAPLDGSYDQAHTFTDFAHWIVPGHLLIGRYPYCEPSRCKSRDVGEEQLQKILDAGVTAFVSLQAELPPQEQMRIGGVNGFLPYRATAQLLAAAMSGPPPMESLHALRTPDLDKFLPPRRKVQETPPVGTRRELQFLHVPVEDLGLPSEEQTVQMVDMLADTLRNGQVVYMHCWGGRGRSGTVAACLLGKAFGVPAAEALQRVQRAYNTRETEHSSPETPEQVAFVKDFIAKYGSR